MNSNRSQSYRLILASGSPRRRELLRDAGYTFEVITPDESAESGVVAKETPSELVARLARQKGENVARRIEHGVVIGADTLAVCQGYVLGKPRDVDHAREMLALLRGQAHDVLTGLCLWHRCLWHRPNDVVQVRVATTTLEMAPISDDQLEEYLVSGAWQGKAGAFGYQDGHPWLRIIKGSESNVVGLPMELLAKLLTQLE